MDSSKYIQVIENIHQELMKSELSNNIGLHGGTSGIALFLAYYDRIVHKKNDISPRVMDILEHNIKQINSGNVFHTICSGISGFGWFCEHLRKLGMLDKDDIEFLNDLDPFLCSKMIFDIKKRNYDFLHGALGVGSYFLSRFENNEIKGYLDDLLTELEKSGEICENDGIKWNSVINFETGEKGYNISLSHGMSSIVAFLVRLYQLDFKVERVGELITRTVIYILSQITYSEGSISYFPSYSKESSSGNYFSRLGWCYGDLGVAYTLWQASVVLKNKEWENIALMILRQNCKRHDLQINGIRDAGLCHGSAGIAHIFWSMYLHTQISEFQEATDYWHHITLQMAHHDDGLAGFKNWRTIEYGGPEKSENLLEGVAGIGIALLSYLNSNLLTWDECLMLNLLKLKIR